MFRWFDNFMASRTCFDSRGWFGVLMMDVRRIIQGQYDPRTRIVLNNAAGSFLIKIFAMGIDFAKIPVLLTFLEPRYYGVYITIVSIVAWTHQFDFGLGSGLRYHLTEAIAKHDDIRGKQLTSTAYLSLSCIMIIVLLICIPIVNFLNWKSILNCNFIGLKELRLCVCMVLFVFVVQFVLELILVVLEADQKAAISSIFRPLANLLMLLLIIILRKYAHNSMILACLVMTIPIVLVLFVITVFLFFYKYRNICPSFLYFNKLCIKEIYSLGIKYFVSQVSSLVVFGTANVLITHYVTSQDAAVYSIAFTYFGVIVMLNNMVLRPLIPAITDSFVKGDIFWIRNIFKNIRKYSFFLSIASIGLLVFSQVIFKLWLRGRIQVPWNLSIFMTLYFLCNIWAAPYRHFLSGVGKLNIMVIISCCKIIVFFPVAIILIKYFNSIGLVIAIIIINTLPNMVIGIIQYNLIVSNKAKGLWNQ